MIADQITGAPDDAWTMLGMIGGAAAAALIYGTVKLIQFFRAPEPQTLHADGQTYDMTGVSKPLVDMLQNALNRIEHLEGEQASLRTINTGLNGQVVILKAGARPLVAWIDGGAPPPPPDVENEFRQALEEHHATEP